MPIRKRVTPVLPALLTLIIGTILAFFSISDVFSDRLVFVSLTLLLVIYLLVEITQLRSVHSERWILNPVVLCSFMTFMMGYGLTNILYFMPSDQLELLGLVPEVTTGMAKLMWLALIAAVGMWLGYWSPIAVSLSRPRLIAKFQSCFIPQSNTPKLFALPLLVAVDVGACLLQIKLGVFGYSSNYERLVEMGSVTQYLALASKLGELALVLAAFRYYTPGTGLKGRGWLYSILALEVVFGLLSGFKSAAVMPFVIVGLCQYLRAGKIPKNWVVFTFIGIAVAYAIIEPFRVALNANSGYERHSITDIASTLITSADNPVAEAVEKAPLIVAIASRQNLSYIGSFGVDFADQYESLPPGTPDFLTNIFLAPFHAWIPRFIWDSKPLGDLGLWYNQIVMGNNHFSSTAMGPLTYLYFAGGGIAVFAGFFFIGIMQRCFMFILNPAVSIAGGVVFMAMLNTISQIDSSVNGIIITIFRELPLVILLLFLIFRRRGMAVKTVSPTATINARIPPG